jgi:hypothetical protein
MSEIRFTNVEGKEDAARVLVEIDYTNKRYSITPFCGSKDGKFEFKDDDKSKPVTDKLKWRAIIAAIDAGIKYAEKELANLITNVVV